MAMQEPATERHHDEYLDNADDHCFLNSPLTKLALDTSGLV